MSDIEIDKIKEDIKKSWEYRLLKKEVEIKLKKMIYERMGTNTEKEE